MIRDTFTVAGAVSVSAAWRRGVVWRLCVRAEGSSGTITRSPRNGSALRAEFFWPSVRPALFPTPLARPNLIGHPFAPEEIDHHCMGEGSADRISRSLLTGDH